jgi:bisphosphoglycerate-independent phosphoglycerate mutase (AlkP superfamily)
MLCAFAICLQDLKFVGMMQYDGDLLLPKNFLVPPPEISGTSGEYLVHNGISTFACSETQKFGHVTFFWNGNRSGYFDSKLETYLEVQRNVQHLRGFWRFWPINACITRF